MYRDVTRLGFEHPVAWTLTVFVTGPIGVLVYLATVQIASEPIGLASDRH